MQNSCNYNRLFLTFLLFFCVAATADEIDDGMKAYDEGDYVSAYRILLPLAEHHGYSQAMNTLGILYENGFGVEKQGGEADKWYRKAALEGGCEETFVSGFILYLPETCGSTNERG